MRLRLFDRIRRLTHRRRPSMPPGSESSGGAQGRHRRRQRGESPPAPSAVTLSRHGSPATAEWPTSSAPPATLTPPSRPAPGSPSLAGPDGFPPSGASLAPRPPAAGAGAARARIREAPQDAAPVGVDAAARPAPARPYAPRPHWYEAARLGRSPEARAGQADARAAVCCSPTAISSCRRAIRAIRFASRTARVSRCGPAIVRSSAAPRSGSGSSIFLPTAKMLGCNFSSAMHHSCVTRAGGSKRYRRFRFASLRQATSGVRKSTRTAPRNGSSSSSALTSTARASRSCRC